MTFSERDLYSCLCKKKKKKRLWPFSSNLHNSQWSLFSPQYQRWWRWWGCYEAADQSHWITEIIWLEYFWHLSTKLKPLRPSSPKISAKTFSKLNLNEARQLKKSACPSKAAVYIFFILFFRLIFTYIMCQMYFAAWFQSLTATKTPWTCLWKATVLFKNFFLQEQQPVAQPDNYANTYAKKKKVSLQFHYPVVF